jgi:gluconolactonase
MIHRKWPILVLIAAASAASLAAFVACSETGPDAEPRTNGCIGDGCFDGSVVVGQQPREAGLVDSPITITDPLEGVTPTATLVKGGFKFTEGPVWIDGRLIFSDPGANTMHQLLADGGVTQFRGNSGKANGNAVDSQGRLVTCEGAPDRRRVTRTDAQLQNPQPIATTFKGVAFNEPNDVIVRADGNVYFTDPRYSNSPDGGQDKLAVYRLAPGAAATGAERIAFDFSKPNGIALSPDGNTLYVIDNGDGRVLAAQLDGNGAVSGTFAKLADAAGGDGVAVDDLGNLYVAATAGVLVLDKTGSPLGTITIPQGAPSNCAFGGSDRKTLFITSNVDANNPATGLYAIKLNVPGLP